MTHDDTIDWALAKIEKARPQRFDRQQHIEHLIQTFAPDATEGQELLDALWSALEQRYEERVDGIHKPFAKLREAIGGLK